jgi:hypothetical protein
MGSVIIKEGIILENIGVIKDTLIQEEVDMEEEVMEIGI